MTERTSRQSTSSQNLEGKSPRNEVARQCHIGSFTPGLSATSFPGSLFFPPKAIEKSIAFGGKKRDPGIEVGLSVCDHTFCAKFAIYHVVQRTDHSD